MKTILLATVLFFLSIQSSLSEPPNKVLKAFKQKFPSAINIKWTEEDNIFEGSSNSMGKISKHVTDYENTWKANFILGDRKTSATFDLEGHWLISQQEIILQDIGIEEVVTAIKKDYKGCEILSIKRYNQAGFGTWYDVEGKCGNKPKAESYDYIGFPYPHRQ